MCSNIQNVLFRKQLQIKLLTAKGQEFENFFKKLMVLAYPQDFIKNKSHGSAGDLKCDGYLSSTKTVFQCYSPSSLKENILINKINTDLSGAIQHWYNEKRMKEWIFVYNENDGLPTRVAQLLTDLKEKYSKNNPSLIIKWWENNDLINLLSKLSLNNKIELLGDQPSSEDFSQLNYNDLQKVIDHLDQNIQIDLNAIIQAPSPYKAKNNQLSQVSADLLMIGRRSFNLLDKFFQDHHDPQIGDRIAQSLKKYFKNLENINHVNENIFNLILDKIDGFKQKEVTSKAAAYSIMAYFFDKCEIFKDPGYDLAD